MPTTFANSINSNPIYAERAEKDAAGNTISTTYATKSELPSGVPSVTSSDDGKVLTADYTGGVASYSWETPSAGGGNNYVNLTYNSSTWSDFSTAYTKLQNGEVDGIRVVYTGPLSVKYAELAYVLKNGSIISRVYFVCPQGDSTTPTGSTTRKEISIFQLTPGGTWSTDKYYPFDGNISGGSGVAVSVSGSNYVIGVTAGNMISTANNEVAVSTTAGITDIQLVNSLPASPVSTVLYLIPET